MDSGAHHLHIRKRVHQKHEPYPSTDVLKGYLDKIMYAVSIAAPLALIPQVIQAFATQDVANLSMFTWLLLGFFNVLWTLYGIVHRAYPIIISSAASGILQFSIVIAILLYS